MPRGAAALVSLSNACCSFSAFSSWHIGLSPESRSHSFSHLHTSWKPSKASLLFPWRSHRRMRKWDLHVEHRYSFWMGLIAHPIFSRAHRYASTTLVGVSQTPLAMPFRQRILSSAVLSTESKLTFKWRMTFVGRRCVWWVSRSWRLVEIWSMKPGPRRNPVCCSWTFLPRVGVKWQHYPAWPRQPSESKWSHGNCYCHCAPLEVDTISDSLTITASTPHSKYRAARSILLSKASPPSLKRTGGGEFIGTGNFSVAPRVYSYGRRTNYVSTRPCELISVALDPKVECLSLAMNVFTIYVTYGFTCRSSLLAIVAYELRQFFIVNWNCRCFWFLGHFNPPIFTVLLSAHRQWTL